MKMFAESYEDFFRSVFLNMVELFFMVFSHSFSKFGEKNKTKLFFVQSTANFSGFL